MSQKPKYQGTIPFTFGVELEFDFAANNETAAGYFEDLVRKNPDSTLFRTEKNLRPKSNEMKALIRVAQILKQNGRSVQVLPHAKVAPDYTVWQITHDCTARIKAPNTLNTYLSDELKIPDNDFRSWKHEGLELVSPPLEVPLVASGSLQGGSLPEIEKYLDALRNQPKMPYRVVSDIPYTGFHVHVGIRPDDPEYSEISLKVLQHLSFLLIQYEDVISSFHPFSRRGPCNTALLDEVPISSMVDNIRDMIFAEDMTVKKLTELMDRESAAPQRTTRHKFVNFEPLNRRKRDLRTVEFRQHQGTLSPEDTRQWVSFLTALMRLAEQRAGVKLEQALTVPLIPTVVSSPSLERARELLNLLGLDVQARSYWLLRFDRYKTVPQEFSEMLEERPCPTCRKREGGGKFESGQTKREIDDGEGWQEVKNNKKNHHRRRI